MRNGLIAAALLVCAAPLAADPAAESDAALELVGLAEGNRVLRFSAEGPGAVRAQPLTGLSGALLGIDVRPADGRLYGVTTTNDLFEIDLARGAARRVSTLTRGFEGSPRSGFDFNPQADRLRLVAESGQNLRVHVALGAVATDGPLAYAQGDRNAGERPHVTAVAYTDNRRDAPVTRTFDIDWRLDVLALQEPPNDGALQTVGPLGADFGPLGGFDIHTQTDGSETAYAVSGATLYALDLESGAARVLGLVGDGSVPLIGLAILPDPR